MTDNINLTSTEDGDILLTVEDGISTFIDLTDTPANYTGQATKSVIVNATEDGLEFLANINTDEKSKVSANDTTAGFLNGKLVAGTNISLVENNDGANETLTIDASTTGEINTASNVGVGGTGLFKQKTGPDLEFKNLNAGSNKITIIDDVVNNEVDIDLGVVNASDIVNTPAGDIAAINVQAAINELDTEKFNIDKGNRMSSTGLIDLDGVLAINVDPTKIDIPAGRGQHVDNSDPDNPVFTNVSWLAQTVAVVDIATTPFVSYVVDKFGVINQLPARPIGIQLRDTFMVGASIHIASIAVDVITITKAVINSVALTVGDLSDSLGNIEFSNDKVSMSPNGVNLSLDMSSGKSFSNGENFVNNKGSANVIDFPGSTLEPFFQFWRDGSGDFTITPKVTVLNPGRYDDGTGGVTEPNGIVGPLEFQNFMMFFAPTNGNFAVHYGQNKYDSIIGATVSRQSEFINAIISPDLQDEIFIGFITVRGDATDLSDSTQANIGRGTFIDEFYDNITGLGDGIVYNKDTEIIVVANGTTTTVELQITSGGDVTIQLDGQSFNLADDGVDNLVNLTHGTDIAPVLNFVYAIISGSKAILQASTTKPTVAGVGLFANVKQYIVQSATTVQTDGFLASQETTDKFASDDQSHIRHINDIVRENARWVSGVDPTITITTQPSAKDDLFVSLTSGIVRQLHKHIWSAFINGDDIYVANDQTIPFTKITNLNSITTDTTGATLETNNTRYNLVIWGSQDEDGTDRKVFVNKPTGSYNNDSDAINDINNTAVKSFPNDFAGSGFLIARIVVRFQTASSGTLSIVQINGVDFEDLRTITGEGGGTTIVQNEFSDAVFRVFNSTDPTKQLAFNNTSITTGNTRTLTSQDKDYVIADDADLTTHISETVTHGTLGSIVGTTDPQTLTNKTLTTPSLTLNQSTTPTPTAEGDIQWDTDGNQIVIGDSVGQKIFSDDTVVQNRANHTGTQLASTISDFQTTVSANTDVSGSKTKTDFITITQAVDLDIVENDTTLNNTHRISDGSDHTFINQNVTTTASPTFVALTLSGLLDGMTNITYTGQSASPIFTLSDGATITPDFDDGNIQEVTLGGNRTLAAPLNQKSGARYSIIVNQDVTGSRVLTFNSVYKFAGGTIPTLTTTTLAKDVLVFISDGTNLISESGLDYK